MIHAYRPMAHYVEFKCSYSDTPYKFRQKLRRIEGLLLEVSTMAKKHYKLFVFEDGTFLYDVTYNRILWQLDFMSSSMAVLMSRLEDLVRFWSYEEEKVINQISYNHHFKLLKMYGYKKGNY